MGRNPCCDKSKVRRGTWSPEEDAILKNYLQIHGTGNWISLPHKAGLKRCGKSCRLRWLNYLRPNIKLGGFTEDEDFIISNLFSTIGSRWSIIASHLPGRTDNDVKNYWHTKLKKKFMATKSDVATASADAAAVTATFRVAPPENDMNFPFCPPQLEQDASPFWSFCNDVRMEELSWEILSGILPQEEVGADVDADLFSIFHFDSEARGVSQHH